VAWMNRRRFVPVPVLSVSELLYVINSHNTGN
jgi:hypothetical protein